MATITPLLPSDRQSSPPLLVSEPKTTSGLQSLEGRQIAEVTENILLILNKFQEYLDNTGEIDYNPVPPKRSEQVTMSAQFKGRGKPLPYPMDEE